MAIDTAMRPVADAATDALKVPPHSIEAEQSVLGGLMLDNEAWWRAVMDGSYREWIETNYD